MIKGQPYKFNIRRPKALVNKRISANWVILFLLWPLGTLIGALRKFRTPQAKSVVWLFCIYYGFVFVYSDPNAEKGADSARYAASFIYMHSHWLSFDYLASMFYNPDGYTDIYQPLATWLISAFTDNPRWLFSFFGGVFGIFYVNNLWMIFQRISAEVRVGIVLFLFMFTYALINPIWNINGVRMWTAAQVFVYGVLRYYLQNDRKGLIWVASSALFHFSFLFPSTLLFLFLFIPHNLTILVIFFFAASLVSKIDLGSIRTNLSFLPSVFQPKVEGFTSERYIESLKELSYRAWHVTLANSIDKWLIYVWVAAIYILRKKWINELPHIKTIFAFSLFLGGFAQLASHIASGGRFLILANMIFYAVFIVVLAQKKVANKLQVLKFITIPFMTYLIIFSIRVGFERTGLLAYFGNPIIALFIENKLTLIELIKGL